MGKLLCLRSKPTAVTANESIDIAGKLLISVPNQQHHRESHSLKKKHTNKNQDMTTPSSSSGVVPHQVDELKSQGNDTFCKVCVSIVMPGGSGIVLVYITSCLS